MAANMTGMRVEGTTVIGRGEKHGRGRGQRLGAFGVVVVLLAALVIGSVALHSGQASHSAAPAIPRSATRAEPALIENNTTNFPTAVTAEALPIVSSGEQKFLDVNSAWLPAAADMGSSVMTSSQRRLIEVNTTMMPAETALQAARECTRPAVGFPTCYSLQDDGTWAREELADTGTVWITVGIVTYDEMKAAVGELSASAS